MAAAGHSGVGRCYLRPALLLVSVMEQGRLFVLTRWLSSTMTQHTRLNAQSLFSASAVIWMTSHPHDQTIQQTHLCCCQRRAQVTSRFKCFLSVRCPLAEGELPCQSLPAPGRFGPALAPGPRVRPSHSRPPFRELSLRLPSWRLAV